MPEMETRYAISMSFRIHQSQTIGVSSFSFIQQQLFWQKIALVNN